MDTALFDYTLPPELIAQRPADRRDESRLLVLRRTTGCVAHHRFGELPDLLRAGDLLVLNDTRVIPARLCLRRKSGSRIEGLFLKEADGGRWTVMLRGRGRIREGEVLDVEGAEGQALRLCESLGEGAWAVAPEPVVPAMDLLERAGRSPLPPYIRRKDPDADLEALDRRRYQTVFAREPGAVAAPTAGLHFTPEVFRALEARGVERTTLTLHVGLGTFKPVATEQVERHRMHAERFRVPPAAAEAIRSARNEGRRVIAVGTTVVRVLESLVRRGGLVPTEGETDLFIYPAFEFHVVDGLVTNFHLPRSTLLMLVSAFAGREFLLRAYEEAVARQYRFYSYGDACLIE